MPVCENRVKKRIFIKISRVIELPPIFQDLAKRFLEAFFIKGLDPLPFNIYELSKAA
jgi:hypothetical protein